MAGVHQYPNPADHPDAQPFLRHLAESRGDPLARMEFADWLQEQGYDNAAQGQRWAAKHNKVPNQSANDPNYSNYRLNGWFVSDASDYFGRAHATLPSPFSRGAYRAGVNLVSGKGNIPEYEANTLHEKDLLATMHHLDYDDEGEPYVKPRQGEDAG